MFWHNNLIKNIFLSDVCRTEDSICNTEDINLYFNVTVTLKGEKQFV